MKNGLETDVYGNKWWYKDGKLHREDGSAIEGSNGDKYWYKDGKLHREDGPAIEYINGDKYWYGNGVIYREDDLPHLENMAGDKKWFYKYRWYDSFEEYILARVVG